MRLILAASIISTLLGVLAMPSDPKLDYEAVVNPPVAEDDRPFIMLDGWKKVYLDEMTTGSYNMAIGYLAIEGVSEISDPTHISPEPAP
jgi:hypothetical protein